MSDLRHMAKLWGWTVKGTAKAVLVQTLVANLADPTTMAVACAALPALEYDVLRWLSILPGRPAPEKTLAPILAQSTGKAVSEAEVAPIVHDLDARGLLRAIPQGGFEVPVLYREWMAGLASAGLVYEVNAEPAPSPSTAALSLHADNLLSFIDADAPKIALPSQDLKVVEEHRTRPGTGPVSSEILSQWGYTSPEDQQMARFLVTTLIHGGWVQVSYQKTPARLQVEANQAAAWQGLAPAQQRILLIQTWMQQGPGGASTGLPAQLAWTEFDLALEFHRQHRSGFALQQTRYYYGSEGSLTRVATAVRQIVARSVGLLDMDTWFSFERFCQVLRAYSPTLMVLPIPGDAVQWTFGDRILDPKSMDPSTWLATYGSQVAAWLSGPAKWLGLIEVAYKDGLLVAFRRPQAPPTAQHIELPSDALRYLPDGQIALRSIWQAAELRDLVRQIASLEVRDRSTMTYRLDPAAFRAARTRGATADQLAKAFAGLGFPLPTELQQRVTLWESRAGRFHIYDHVAAIELGDDLALREVESAAALGQKWAYPASTRCLVLLEPANVPDIVESLQRRGYMPKVTS